MKDWGSIFKVLSINPFKSKWEDYLYTLTPIQKIGTLFFKREDLFAPLGYGGINGAKLRQAIWLIYNQSLTHSTKKLISGASIKSPQLPMSSAVAYYYGMTSEHVIGATTPTSSIKKDMVCMATWFKASFHYLRVGYNPVLQKTAKQLASINNLYYLHYGITVANDSSSSIIEQFHYLGGNQVQNIPKHIKTLIIPAGSGNSAISILYGIGLFPPPNLKTIFLLGIGPEKLDFIFNRLLIIGKYIGKNLLNFKINNNKFNLFLKPDKNAINIFYQNIHNIHKYNYQNNIKQTYNEIIFHPTYEAKMFDYMLSNYPDVLLNKNTLFWIIGSQPSIERMAFLKKELGPFPSKTIVKTNKWLNDDKKKKTNKCSQQSNRTLF